MPIKETFIFGLILAFYVGPIAILLINIGVKHGLWEVSKCALGVALADFTYALVSFASGNYILNELIEYKIFIEIFAAITLMLVGGYLVLKSYNKWQKIRIGFDTIKDGNEKIGHMESFDLNNEYKMKSPGLLGMYMITAINPLTIISFTAFFTQVYIDNSNLFTVLLLAVTVFSASLLAQLLFSLLSHFIKPFFENYKVVIGFDVLSGLAIILFGGYGILKVIMKLYPLAIINFF